MFAQKQSKKEHFPCEYYPEVLKRLKLLDIVNLAKTLGPHKYSQTHPTHALYYSAEVIS